MSHSYWADWYFGWGCLLWFGIILKSSTPGMPEAKSRARNWLS